MRWVIRTLIFDFALLLVYLAACFYVTHMPRNDEEKTIVIAPHTGTQQIIAQLHEAQLSPPLWLMAPSLAAAKLRGAPTLKAGEYLFPPHTSTAEAMSMIRRGEVVVHQVTIPEGWNSFQVRAALAKEELLTGDIPAIAEGSIFPDTMRFARGEARSAVLARMQHARDTVLADLWKERAENLPLKTPDEALVLASIVEKETGVHDERAKVAGVFINRLRMGMALQTDPTVAYGVEAMHGGAPMGRALTTDDLQRDTPYNTYTRVGLPPTPICNPGRAALLAALHPEATDALYFVATGTGGHVFSATLKEHEQHVAAYRAFMRGAAAAESNKKQ